MFLLEVLDGNTYVVGFYFAFTKCSTYLCKLRLEISFVALKGYLFVDYYDESVLMSVFLCLNWCEY